MASKTLSLNKLISSDFSEGSSWVLNKGGGGDTDTGYFVFMMLQDKRPLQPRTLQVCFLVQL